jgi:NADH-quinone oxidoreductase subunit A
MAWVAFADIGFFFGVLLVGFAYLWQRGDLNWVRSLAAQKEG